MRSDRTVVVTGAAGEIGSLVARRFAANGDTVIAVDVDADALSRFAAGSGIQTIVADVADEAGCATVAAGARDIAGGVDVLVNIAGWFPIQPFDELSVADFRRVVDVNLIGTFLMIRAIWPLMKGRGWGRIVNTGSGSIYEGVPDQLPYVAAKAGVLGLTRSFARIAGAEGVTVNLVAPGLTSTEPLKRNVPPAVIEKAAEARVIQREEQADDLVGAYVFLASPDAEFITAQTILVDGGAHML